MRVMGLSGVAVGDVLNLAGTAGTDGKEAVLKNGYVSSVTHGPEPRPLGVSSKGMGYMP